MEFTHNGCEKIKEKYMKKLIVILLIGALALTCFVAAAPAPDVNARAYVLLSADSGDVLGSENAQKHTQIASMVKIMTLNIIFERIENGSLSVDDMISVSDYAASMGGSQAFLEAGGVYKVDELIKSIVVASANDSCVALAEHISGSVEGFVCLMNEKASEYEMENTKFVNCTGLPDQDQYSCAEDVGKMFMKLIEKPEFFEYSGIWMFDFVHPGGRVTSLSNTNKLVRFYQGCDGGKTGYTSEAGSCLAATAKRGDTRFVAIVVGAENSKTRNAEVSKMFNYAFANYKNVKVLDKEEEIGKFAVSGSKEKEVGYRAASDRGILEDIAAKPDITYDYVSFNPVAPIKAGDEIGRVVVIKNGEKIMEEKLLAMSDINRRTFKDLLDEITENW